MKLKFTFTTLTACVITFFISCSKTENRPQNSLVTDEQSLQGKIAGNGTNPDEAIFLKSDSSLPSSVNHFYIESNGNEINTVLVFTQKQNGQLVLEDEVVSGGNGLNKPLDSQGALAISDDKKLLFVVNAGSDNISSFRIKDNGGFNLAV